MVTVPASLSDCALAPVTPESALSTPLTQPLQQRWTLLSLTLVSAARADQPIARRMDASVRMFFIMVVGNVVLVGRDWGIRIQEDSGRRCCVTGRFFHIESRPAAAASELPTSLICRHVHVQLHKPTPGMKGPDVRQRRVTSHPGREVPVPLLGGVKGGFMGS